MKRFTNARNKNHFENPVFNLVFNPVFNQERKIMKRKESTAWHSKSTHRSSLDFQINHNIVMITIIGMQKVAWASSRSNGHLLAARQLLNSSMFALSDSELP